MSADNWAVCPRCFSDACKEAELDREVVMESYGKVPVEEFDAARERLVDPSADDFHTFREDYEFWGAEDGEVHALYKGRCTVCSLATKLELSKRFWPDTVGA